MSPEQARGGSVGPVSDLFSLGAVIYFMLAARPPWRAERSLAVLHRIVEQPHRPLWQVNPDVPREVSDLVDRLLCKSPDGRGESADKIQVELEQMLSQMQNPDHPHSLVNSQVAKAKPSFFSHPAFVAPLTAVATTMAIFMLLPLVGWNLFGWNLNPESAQVSRPINMQDAYEAYAADVAYEAGEAVRQPSSYTSSTTPQQIVLPTSQTSLNAPQQNTLRRDNRSWNTVSEFNAPKQSAGTVAKSESPVFANELGPPKHSPGLVAIGEPTEVPAGIFAPTKATTIGPNTEPIDLTPSEISTTKESVWSEIAMLESLLRQAETSSTRPFNE
jgi:serine/threonine protein kinase